MANFNVGELAKARAEATRNKIKSFLVTYPGIKNIEIADRLEMTPSAIGRHVEAIRQEWQKETA